jgi:hypothetical protein
MSVGTVDDIERTVQKTNEWVAQVADELGTEDHEGLARPAGLPAGRARPPDD